MPRARPEPVRPPVACNRCNRERTFPAETVCPGCGCPEFRHLLTPDEIEAATKPGRRGDDERV